MCGIGLLLSISEHSNHSQDVNGWNDLLEDALSSRGPDLSRRSCQYNTCHSSLTLHSSVLHMRGDTPTAQPLLFSLGSSFYDETISDEPEAKQRDCAFCWNGECYTYAVDCVEELQDENRNEFVNYSAMNELVANENSQERTASLGLEGDSQSHNCNQSDTEVVQNLLSQSIASIRQHIDKTSPSNDFVHLEHKTVALAMSRIHGEYSFLLYTSSQTSLQGQQRHGCVYFGRDMLGRRSLVINRSIHGLVLISSVATKYMEDESDATSSGNIAFNARWEELPPGIVFRLDTSTGEVTSISIPRLVNRALQLPALTNNTIDGAAAQLLHLLDKSIQRRVKDAPSSKSKSQSDAFVAILFSGGIDSVVLAALSDRHISSNRPIDLINVSFHDDSDSNSVSPDRLAALTSFVELKRKWPKRNWRFIAADISYQEVLAVESRILRLINPLDSTMDFNIAVAFYFAGKGKGWLMNEKYANALINGTKNSHLGPNAASQEPMLRFAQSYDGSMSSKGCQFSPSQKIDRQRSVCVREGCNRPAPAGGCLFNACKFCCGKLQSPICKFVGQRVQICPAHNRNANNTNSHTMTLSGARVAESREKSLPITSNAKILISGVGADEQMAGYGRHRTTFQRGGYDELKTELEMEVGRLWTRNLGRDDRCLSDFGREARFPYLDEDVVAYLAALPMQLKCDLRLSQGEGDKMILRKVAIMLGLNECSGLVKRAIQFGSRIAKVSDKNRYGSQRQATGRAKHVRG